MGYTHYWEYQKKFTQKQWDELKKSAKQIFDYCEELEMPLVNHYSEGSLSWEGYPLIDNDCIKFNGKGEEGHETFVLYRLPPERQPWMLTKNPFAFVKTSRKPYDLAVCLMLMAAFMVAPDVLLISSDGEWEDDWIFARKAYYEVFGEDAVFPFEHGSPSGDIPPFHHQVSMKPEGT